MRFPDSLLRTIRDRVSIVSYAGRRLSWDRRKSVPARGDYWANCPFHGEKTASFHVRDHEGTYKCFGCGEGGDVFGLCMKLEGVSFPEAVERLADEAGVALPDFQPQAPGEADRRKRLFQIMARAQALYAAALKSDLGRVQRDYLKKRDLGETVWAQFGLGYAPGGDAHGWSWTGVQLEKEGFKREELIACGLLKASDRGGQPYDVFRERIMFPIHDPQGRVIAFGGRTLDPEAPAKYLNSPETELFHKSRNLYRLKEARARLSATKGEGLVLGEGYLDVAAFERAGAPAVAPLGTALTEEQLALLWKVGPCPTLCFDGDAAGKRAAHRALDLALPHLGPERTLKIALLPERKDPDDVFREDGPEALLAILAQAKPAVEALFERERDRQSLATPEAKAGLKARLAALAARIEDEETKKQYRSALMDMAFAATRRAPTPFAPRPQGAKGAFRRGFEAPPEPTEALKSRIGGDKARHFEDVLRQVVDAPWLLDRGREALAALPIPDPELDLVRHALLDRHAAGLGIDRASVHAHLHVAGEPRAAARVFLWPRALFSKPAEGKEPKHGDPGAGLFEETPGEASPESVAQAPEAEDPSPELKRIVEAQWMALVTLDTTLPKIKDDLTALRGRGADLDEDDAAFARAQALLHARIDSERRLREAADAEEPPAA
jgi:DNA primase